MKQNTISRLYFLSKGCKQVPLEYARGIVRLGHPDGYFLNARGQRLAVSYPPSQVRIQKDTTRKTGKLYPKMPGTGTKSCHFVMALAFYGERPTYSLPLRGKGGERGSYVGICHHLIPDPLDYKPANLLCWLTRAEHTEADRRQRALKTVVPDGDLPLFSSERLRELQDPRVTSDEQFQRELDLLRKDGFHRDPRSSDEIMLHDMTHHMEV